MLHLSAERSRTGGMAPYSVDIRWRIVWQRLSKDLTFAEIAERLNVLVSTVHGIY